VASNAVGSRRHVDHDRRTFLAHRGAHSQDGAGANETTPSVTLPTASAARHLVWSHVTGCRAQAEGIGDVGKDLTED
jgi:hypothetical protein